MVLQKTNHVLDTIPQPESGEALTLTNQIRAHGRTQSAAVPYS